MLAQGGPPAPPTARSLDEQPGEDFRASVVLQDSPCRPSAGPPWAPISGSHLTAREVSASRPWPGLCRSHCLDPRPPFVHI